MKIRGFITHKQAEYYSDCADYFAINRESRKIAVSDGISQSFSPSEWSRILVQSYIENKWEPEQDIKPLQSQWLNEVHANLNKLQKQGAVTYMMENMIDERESAGATFCGLSFDGDYNWVCNVLGDSALVKLSGNSIEIFSSQDGSFNNRPDYFDSYVSQPVGKIKTFRDKLDKGDVLFVVSDPFSELFQKSIENNTDKQIINKLLSIKNQDDFCNMVESLRADFGMHNDDSTLVIIEYDGTRNFNIEQIVLLDELLEMEQRKTEEQENRYETYMKETDKNESIIESKSEAMTLIKIRETAWRVFLRCYNKTKKLCIPKGIKNKNLCGKNLREKSFFDYFWRELIKELKS